MGLTYGHTFQGLDDVRVDNNGNAIGSVDIKHWKVVDPHSKCKPHLIHPAALDAVLQLALTALSGSQGLENIPTVVPTCVKNLWISSALGEDDIDSVVNVWASSQKTGFRDIQTAITVTSCQTSQIHMKIDASMMAIDRAVSSIARTRDPARRYYKVDWQPDVEFLNDPTQLDFTPARSKEIATPIAQEADMCLKKEWLCLSAMSTAIQDLPETYHAPRSHLGRYVDWMKRKLSGREESFERYEMLKKHPEANSSQFQQSVRDFDAEGFIITKIAMNLPKLLSGEIDPLQFLFSDDSLRKLYNEHWAIGLKDQVRSYVRALGHKKPGLKILEVGAGTGGLTAIMLEGLDAHPENSHRSSYFTEYAYTDISPSFFMQAKERFGELNIKYRTLDIAADAESQGFKLGDYDVVAASNVLHATVDLDATLKNCRSLLKSGGKLILHENMNPDRITSGMIFGLLPGWWLSSEQHRHWSPLQSRTSWQDALVRAGFSGEEILLQGSNQQNFETTPGAVMISRAVSPSNANLEEPPTPIVMIIYDQSSDDQYALYQELRRQHTDLRMKSLLCCVSSQSLHGSDFSHSTVVMLPALDRLSLQTMRSDDFALLQIICAQAKRMVWLGKHQESTGNLESSMAAGMARSIESEILDFNFITLTVETPSNVTRIANYIWYIIDKVPSRTSNRYENEYVERNGVLHIPRVVEAVDVTDRVFSEVEDNISNKQVSSRRWDDNSQKLMRLGVESVGLLDTLVYEEVDPWSTELAHDQVELKVLAVGLNFVDVLTALGQVSHDYIGNELAGLVTKVPHNGNVNLRVGDIVIGCHNGTMVTKVRCKAWQLHRIPPNMSVTDAATLPLVYCTVYYGLVTWARAQPGESILIHSGAGGVGQAAIQLSKYLGLTIFTTTSSYEKAKLLMDTYGIPRSHIFNSRSLDFADGVRALTAGIGVDIVLNSLSGEALRESFNLVAPFGRFLELGKRDIYSTGISALGGLPMHTFSKNVMFASVNLPSLYLLGDRISGILSAVVELAAEGKIKPPSPVQVFAAGETEQAFRTMQSGKITGKIVLDYTKNCVLNVKKIKRTRLFDENASYVIAGGLGGIAKNICKWMVHKGAKNLILVSRSSPSGAENDNFLQYLQLCGATVVHHACDIADSSRVAQVLGDVKSTMPPIKGCIQSAMVLQVRMIPTHRETN